MRRTIHWNVRQEKHTFFLSFLSFFLSLSFDFFSFFSYEDDAIKQNCRRWGGFHKIMNIIYEAMWHEPQTSPSSSRPRRHHHYFHLSSPFSCPSFCPPSLHRPLPFYPVQLYRCTIYASCPPFPSHRMQHICERWHLIWFCIPSLASDSWDTGRSFRCTCESAAARQHRCGVHSQWPCRFRDCR